MYSFYERVGESLAKKLNQLKEVCGQLEEAGSLGLGKGEKNKACILEPNTTLAAVAPHSLLICPLNFCIFVQKKINKLCDSNEESSFSFVELRILKDYFEIIPPGWWLYIFKGRVIEGEIFVTCSEFGEIVAHLQVSVQWNRSWQIKKNREFQPQGMGWDN